MKTIGLLGGMSWESTAVYYQQINLAMRDRLGGLHSAQILLHSYDFAAIAALQRADAWDRLAEILAQTGQALERAGADCLAICTNTMHKVAEEVQAAVDIPLIDIREVTGAAIRTHDLKKVCLLGTRYTMEQTFFRTPLSRAAGLEIVVPEEGERACVHAIIFEELCQGIVCPASRETLSRIMAAQAQQGVDGMILGCTELMLLVDQEHCPLPLFDTTTLHAQALVDFALGTTSPRPGAA
jgi:aspartate racemase